MRKKRGIVFMVFSRVALLLIITAAWTYPHLGPVHYTTLLMLSVLIAWVGKKPESHPLLDQREELLFDAPVLLCVFSAEDSDKPSAAYSSCHLILSNHRLLVAEKIAGSDVLLAQLRFPDENAPQQSLPMLRTWADFRIRRVTLLEKSLSFDVCGDNEGSAHWGTTTVELVFPQAATCHTILMGLSPFTIFNISEELTIEKGLAITKGG